MVRVRQMIGLGGAQGYRRHRLALTVNCRAGGGAPVPKETITIELSRYSPRQVEAQYFSIIAQPLDLRSRSKLIKAQYRLLEPQIAHIGYETASRHDANL